MDKEDLIIQAISELKDEQKETRKELSAINKTLSSLEALHKRLNKVEDEIKDVPKMRVVVNALVWVTSIVVVGVIGLAFKSILPYIKQDAKGDECIFINYSDGAPSSVSGCAWGYNGVTFTKKVVKEMRELGINVLSYFIDGNSGYGYANDYFRQMYGNTAEFIDTCNLTQISKSMNRKFLEISEAV